MANDARNKLRNMGGIMASFPELVQETQYFQDGGTAQAPVDPIAGRQRDVQRFGIPFSDWQQMSRTERERSGFPVSTLGGELHFDRFGVGLGTVNRGTRFNQYGPAPYQIDEVVPDVSREGPPPSDEFLSAADINRLPIVNAGNMPYRYDPASDRFFRMDGSTVTPQEQEAARRAVLESPEAQMQVEAPRMASEQVLEDAEILAQSRLDEALKLGTDEEIVAARGDLQEAITARSAPQKPATPVETVTLPQRDSGGGKPEPRPLEDLRVPPDRTARARASIKQDPRLSPDNGADTDTGVGGDNGGNDTSPPPRREPSRKDLRSRYKEKIELFKEIYGEDDEDRARDKAMSLAMIGLAIASGQSPNALTNIAQGAMAGVQGMSEQEQARRERDQGLRGLALETAIGEMDAEAERIAQAAESALDFRREVYLQGLNGGNTYGSTTSPISAAVRLFSLKGTEANDRFTPLGKRLSKATPEERRLVILEEVYKDLQPFYGDNMPSFADMSAAVDTTGTGGASPAPGAEDEEIDNILGIQP